MLMYVTRVPNRGSPPAVLLRESYRDGDKVKTRTLANLSRWPEAKIEALRRALKGETVVAAPERLAIDLNIVERYQDVYPTRRQTGAELAQLIHEAAASFEQVALYFEYSLRPVDLPLVGWAAARVGTLLAVRLQEISAYEPKEDKDSKQRDELKYLQGLARDLDRMKRI